MRGRTASRAVLFLSSDGIALEYLVHAFDFLLSGDRRHSPDVLVHGQAVVPEEDAEPQQVGAAGQRPGIVQVLGVEAEIEGTAVGHQSRIHPGHRRQQRGWALAVAAVGRAQAGGQGLPRPPAAGKVRSAPGSQGGVNTSRSYFSISIRISLTLMNHFYEPLS